MGDPRHCPYFGRPQPSNMRHQPSNEHGVFGVMVCAACGEPLTPARTSWRHHGDPLASDERAVSKEGL